MAEARSEAYCTLLLSDAYLPGAMVLAHSLRDNGTKRFLAILVTLDSISGSTIDELKTIYDYIIPVDRITTPSPQNLYLMNRPDLSSSFTKIALWRQTQFSHVVYLDADIVSLRAPDELFASTSPFAAVPDIGWPDCFNSGVLSLKPNMGDYYALLALAQRGISFDGADQGLLNMHFGEGRWERLGFVYNCTPSGNYQYVPAYRHFQSGIASVHFIGREKPWVVGRSGQGGGAAAVMEELVGRWWAVYDKHYRLPTTVYGQGNRQQRRTVQQYVTGEASTANYGFSSSTVGRDADELREPEAPVLAIEPSATDHAEPGEAIEKGEVKPIPTEQQRRFSIDWDATRQAPPSSSKPEAPNFPSEHYYMSSDRNLFKAPKAPSPPKGLYQVPNTPPENQRPPPIFPWESNAPKPTRIFAEDLGAPGTSTAPSSSATASTISASSTNETEASTITPTTPNLSLTSAAAFATYVRTNAWDDMPEIDRYINSLPHRRRAKVQVLFNETDKTAIPIPPSDDPTYPLFSPTSGQPPQPQRRASKVTDFPTEIERPSLPVTPAPIRRPTFWSAERDAQGDLPGADGVPEQSDWDPVARLLELQRRQSEVLEKGEVEGRERGRDIPERNIVESSRGVMPALPEEQAPAEAEYDEKSSQPQGAESVQDSWPAFVTGPEAPDFGTLNFAGTTAPAAETKVIDEVGPSGSAA